MMMLLSSSVSTFSTAFLLALLFSTQWVDTRGFAVKPATGFGPDVEAESGEDFSWSDEAMAIPINIKDGVENIPYVTGRKLGKCSIYDAPNFQVAVKICRKFLLDPPPCAAGGKLKQTGEKQYKCCCKK